MEGQDFGNLGCVKNLMILEDCVLSMQLKFPLFSLPPSAAFNLYELWGFFLSDFVFVFSIIDEFSGSWYGGYIDLV